MPRPEADWTTPRSPPLTTTRLPRSRRRFCGWVSRNSTRQRSRPRQVDLDGDPGVGVQSGQHLHQPIQCEAPEIGVADAGGIRRCVPGETRRLAHDETTVVQHRDDPRGKDSLGLLQVGLAVTEVSEDVPTSVNEGEEIYALRREAGLSDSPRSPQKSLIPPDSQSGHVALRWWQPPRSRGPTAERMLELSWQTEDDVPPSVLSYDNGSSGRTDVQDWRSYTRDDADGEARAVPREPLQGSWAS